MRKVVTGVLAFVLSTSFAAHGQTLKPGAPSLAVGQMWQATSSAGPDVKVIIGRIEPWGDKIAVHVSLSDVQIPTGLPNAGQTMEFAHLPFDGDTLAASLGRLVAESVPPNRNFESGYRQWQSARGGVFTVSVDEAIEFVFRAIMENRKQ
jgi:hypothetical protein